MECSLLFQKSTGQKEGEALLAGKKKKSGSYARVSLNCLLTCIFTQVWSISFCLIKQGGKAL